MPLNRRQFLKSAAATGTAFLLPSTLPGFARAATGNNVVVALFLRGAADGLNIVIPHGDGRYYELRPDFGVPAGAELDLDGFYGLHPAAAPLLPLFQAGKLDAIHAVGSPHETRSHFQAQEFMEKAAPGNPQVLDGWLNRYLAAAGGGEEIAGISLVPAAAIALRGSAPSLAFTNVSGFGVSSSFRTARTNSLIDSYGPLAGTPLGTGVMDALSAVDEIAALDLTTSVTYPDTEVGRALKDAAALIKGDVGVRVITVDMGGWDTHSNAVPRIEALVTDLAASIAAFHTDLGSHSDRTLLLTMTEFGRMAAQNGGAGFDHGHGGFMLALGTTQARGRVLTKNGWPGLSANEMFEGRDLAVTTDFRDVFAEVLDLHLGVTNLAPLLPGFAPNAANYPGLFS